MTVRVLLTLVALVVCFKAEAKDGWAAYGWGTQSCGAWTKAQVQRQPIGADGIMRTEIGSNTAAQAQWVAGFISAFNFYQGVTVNVTGGTDSNGILAWIDAHRLDDISKATVALIAELSQRGATPE
jgi:hypothetical protein